MRVGRLELATYPLVLLMDSWAGRATNFQQYKPANLPAVERDRARQNVLEAIARTAEEGDRLARIEEKGRPIPELARQRGSERTVTTDDLSLRFMVPPTITWVGGGVAIRYRTVDLLM
ncbi:MAG: DUF6470 family protein [Betaproteobacteria bacterium]